MRIAPVYGLALLLVVFVPLPPSTPRHLPDPFGTVNGTGRAIFPYESDPANAPSNIQVSNSGSVPSGEPTLSVNRWGTMVYDFSHKWYSGDPIGNVGMAFSNDSGNSFGANISLGLQGLTPGYEYDVASSAASPNGTFWLTFGAATGSCAGNAFRDIYTVAVWDNGSVWSSPFPTFNCSISSYTLDRDWVASAPNGTVFEIVEDENQSVWFTRSWDGLHFSAPVRIPASFRMLPVPVGAYVFNDTVWAFGAANGTCEIGYTLDSGSHWAMARGSPSGCALSGFQWAATFGAHAELDIAYADAHGIEFSQSTNFGGNWSPPTRISGVTPTWTNFSTPTIDYDVRSGTFSAVWLDTRTAPNPGDWNVYESESRSGGANWSVPRLLSSQTAGVGPQFWPGDFIRNLVTPWGTSAAGWGENLSGGELQSMFAQVPLVNTSAGNVSVLAENLTGGTIAGAMITMDGRTARTGSSGEVTYFDVAPGRHEVDGYDPQAGSGHANSTVSAGQTVRVAVVLGNLPPEPLAETVSVSPAAGFAPLLVSGSANASGGVAPYTFTWSFGDGSPPVESPTVRHDYATAGNYTLVTSVSDSKGDRNRTTESISVHSLPTPLNLRSGCSPTSGVAPVSVTFRAWATGGTGPVTFAWAFGDGQVNRSSLDGNVTHEFARPGTFVATLWANDTGNLSDSKNATCTITVTAAILPPLTATLTASPSRSAVGVPVTFVASARGGSGDYVVYRWDFGDGLGSRNDSSVTKRTFSLPGEFTTTVTIFDSEGARAVAEVNVTIISTQESPPAIASPASSPPTAEIGLLAGGGLAVAGLLLWHALRRGRRPPRGSPTVHR